MGFKPTPEQQAFLAHDPTRHARLHAGPGTGKSATAVAYLEANLYNGNIRRRVRFLTFTRSTTLELRKKIEAVLGDDRIRPSTIHSFAISTLLRNPGVSDFPEPLRIPDTYEHDQLILKHIARMMKKRPDKTKEFFFEMAAKWTRLAPEERPDITAEERARFVGIWLQHRRVSGYTLLDELPNLLREALKAHSDLVGVDFDLLIVDEYQDLNACDLEVLNLLAQNGAALVAIGDEDQSIYSFRRAHPAGIRSFLIDYGTPYDYPLSVSHRCARQIMTWAEHVIRGDPGRTSRPDFTFPAGVSDGEVALLNFPGQVAEAKGCARLVQWLIAERGLPPSQILVLSRADHNGTFTARLRQELEDRSIQVSNPKAVERWMAENGNRRAIAILRLLVHRRDSLAWWTLLELEPRIGEKFLDYAYDRCTFGRVPFGALVETLAPSGFPGASSGQGRLAAAMVRKTLGILDGITLPDQPERSDWGAWITTEARKGRLPSVSPQFAKLLSRLDETLEEEVSLSSFLGQMEPVGKDMMLTDPGGVRFMTMASSKGLTVKATIVLGVDHDLIPHPRGDHDEERRLLYVAMTRSTEYLFLTWASRRKGPAARAGTENLDRRVRCEFLEGGPVESQPGLGYVQAITRRKPRR